MQNAVPERGGGAGGINRSTVNRVSSIFFIIISDPFLTQYVTGLEWKSLCALLLTPVPS